MTRAEYDAAMQKERDAAAAATRRALEGRQRPAAEPPKDTARDTQHAAPGMTPADVARIVSRETAFGRAVERNRLNADQERFLRVAYSTENPDDVAGWVDSAAKVFGVPSQQVAAAPQQAPTMPAKPIPPPPASTTAPGTAVPTDSPEDVLSWDKSMLQDYYDKFFPVPDDPGHPRNGSARRTLAQKVHAKLASRKLLLEPSR